MDIQTHARANQTLLGKPLKIADGFSRVELTTIETMSVDLKQLVHGGFVFGLADYAAMIAVNHPNVVLGASEARFQKPVRVGETLIAEAVVKSVEKNRRQVEVVVKRNGEQVFEGTFTCFVLETHVLG
jgi:acyl-coenzyme A thioesterase PaaI-like protein